MSNGNDTHRKTIGYILWIFGFTGSHRFYYGYPVIGTIYFFTLGLFFIGWIIDLFLIPRMDRRADLRFRQGHIDYNIAWVLLTFLGNVVSRSGEKDLHCGRSECGLERFEEPESLSFPIHGCRDW